MSSLSPWISSSWSSSMVLLGEFRDDTGPDVSFCTQCVPSAWMRTREHERDSPPSSPPPPPPPSSSSSSSSSSRDSELPAPNSTSSLPLSLSFVIDLDHALYCSFASSSSHTSSSLSSSSSSLSPLDRIREKKDGNPSMRHSNRDEEVSNVNSNVNVYSSSKRNVDSERMSKEGDGEAEGAMREIDSIAYVSTTSLTTEGALLGRQLCTRALSVEQVGPGREGTILFVTEEDERSNASIACVFKVRDSRSRGFQRWFVILVVHPSLSLLSAEFLELSSEVSVIAADLKRKAQYRFDVEMKENSHSNNDPKRAAPSRFAARALPHLMHRGGSRTPLRSLDVLIGDTNLFRDIHSRFALVLRRLQFMLEPSMLVTDYGEPSEWEILSKSFPDVEAVHTLIEQRMPLWKFRRFLSDRDFLLVLSNLVIGNQILILSNQLDAARSIALVLHELLPSNCRLVCVANSSPIASYEANLVYGLSELYPMDSLDPTSVLVRVEISEDGLTAECELYYGDMVFKQIPLLARAYDSISRLYLRRQDEQHIIDNLLLTWHCRAIAFVRVLRSLQANQRIRSGSLSRKEQDTDIYAASVLEEEALLSLGALQFVRTTKSSDPMRRSSLAYAPSFATKSMAAMAAMAIREPSSSIEECAVDQKIDACDIPVLRFFAKDLSRQPKPPFRHLVDDFSSISLSDANSALTLGTLQQVFDGNRFRTTVLDAPIASAFNDID